jgi:ubiquinone/menaquinone biosynthesis C-methylase UbiE
VAQVRESYGKIAATRSSCCGPATATLGSCGDSQRLGYSPEELALLPAESDLGLGCGAPLTQLDAQPGETILDLGSGPGLDALLAARAVGPDGRVIGVDMTPEMIERARRNAERAGASQVEFREGRLEELPVEDASIDGVISNCVINLVPDKSRVFREVARVLKPNGRLVISDIVVNEELPEPLARQIPAWAGCVAGAVTRERYFAMLREAGLGDIEILEDRDALALFANDLPEEIARSFEAAGVTAESVRGVVRSLTYRARKAA